MRFIGHTMATPGLSIAEAAAALSEAGCDGLEVICRDGHPLHPESTVDEVHIMAEAASAAGIPIVTITPYAWAINNPDPDIAKNDIRLLTHAVDLAVVTGAQYVRAFGGREAGEDDLAEAAFHRSVHALQIAGRYAEDLDVRILVENHPGTVNRTGGATRALIDTVGCDAVQALYDPANVMHDTEEYWEDTLKVQLGSIGYVHVKDFRYRDDGSREACIVGEGIVPWDRIIPALMASGYQGDFSFEYEKLWNPDDLPDAEYGVRDSIAFMNGLMNECNS